MREKEKQSRSHSITSEEEDQLEFSKAGVHNKKYSNDKPNHQINEGGSTASNSFLIQ